MEAIAENGVTQEDLVSKARYVMGTGLMLGEDFIAQIGKEVMSKIDTTAAYVIKITKPMPAWFFLYGAAITALPPCGCCKIRPIAESYAERWAMGNLITMIDPDSKYRLRKELMFIDMRASGGLILHAPSDSDIAKLHVDCQLSKSSADKPKRPPPTLWQSRAEQQKILHARKRHVDIEKRMREELRCLDRRRYTEAGLVPPPSRIHNLKDIQNSIDNKSSFDPTIDESEPEQEQEVMWRPANPDKLLYDKIQAELRANGPSKQLLLEPFEPCESEGDSIPEDDLFADSFCAPRSAGSTQDRTKPDASHATIPAQEPPRRRGRKKAEHPPSLKNLKLRLKKMQAKSRKRLPQQLDTCLPSLGSYDNGEE